MIFANLPAATEYLAWTVADKFAGSRASFSSQSCSAYVRFSPKDADGDYLVDDDGEEINREVRFSDHGDRHSIGSDRITINIKNRADELTDEDGNFDGYEIADWVIADWIAEASAHLEVRVDA